MLDRKTLTFEGTCESTGRKLPVNCLANRCGITLKVPCSAQQMCSQEVALPAVAGLQPGRRVGSFGQAEATQVGSF